MAPTPDRPDLRQLRTRAKELKRAVEAGDEDAIARVLASHPKFAGRSVERLEGWHVSLRDAQATIAREVGFDSWTALTTELGGGTSRWNASASKDVIRRSFAEAAALDHAHCIDLHFLLALLNPPVPTAAAQALGELGMSYEDVRAGLEDRMPPEPRRSGTSSSPSYQLLLGWAQGIAIGMGASRLTDEHVLLAMAYGDQWGSSRLVTFGVDPDEVVERLRAHGVPTPPLEPPGAGQPIGPAGPWVYFPEEDFGAVTQELVQQYPPGTSHWGTNRSTWKARHWWVHGEDSIPMEAIVRGAVMDPASVEVLPLAAGNAREGAMR